MEENIARVLNELFVIFNSKFFGKSLTKPVLTMQSNQRHNSAMMGWCTTRKMWRQTDTKEEYYEIAICPEFFDLGIMEIADTIMHELVHLYHLQNGIKDVSRGGYYHNHLFKKKAESCGMDCVRSSAYGWAHTSLKPETREFVESLDIEREVFNLTRKRSVILPAGIGGGSQENQGNGENTEIINPARQSYRKYVCPSCGMTVRATKDVNVKCGDCDVTMNKEVKIPKYGLAGNFKASN